MPLAVACSVPPANRRRMVGGRRATSTSRSVVVSKPITLGEERLAARCCHLRVGESYLVASRRWNRGIAPRETRLAKQRWGQPGADILVSTIVLDDNKAGV